MSNRRQFLRNLAGATAGVVFVGCSLCDATRLLAQAVGTTKHKPTIIGKRRIKTVDVHCHVSVPEVRDFLKGTKLERNNGGGGGGYDDSGLTDARLRAMDAMGIDVQAVSILPFWYGAERDLASKLIDFQNEKLAGLVATHPDRFVAFAAVAIQYPELAAEQLEAGMKKWGLRGAAIGDSVNGEELSSPKYDPFWAKAEELQALIFVHPLDSANATGIRNRVQGNGVLGNVIGNPLETTIFVSHMIFDGTLDRFPNLKICTAHAGGYIEAYPDRMDHGCLVFPDQCKRTIKKHPSEYLKQIYVDSIIFTKEGLRHLIAVAGASQIGLGTDYPFPWTVTPVDEVMALPGLSDADRIAILGGNMCKLLKIPT